VITRRTKLLLWLSIVPLVFFAGSLACVPIYAFYLHLRGGGHTSFFITVRVPFLRLLGLTMVLLVWGLLSLLFDRRINETK
jgi:hypothetical protein